MKRYLMLIAMVILAAAASSVWAQGQPSNGPQATYELTWYTTDGGGGSRSGGAYTLDGSLGQTDAGNLSGGGYTLSGGFWSGSAAVTLDHFVFLPVVLK
jgi:hypothetical protein